jgi:hypothetical protein
LFNPAFHQGSSIGSQERSQKEGMKKIYTDTACRGAREEYKIIMLTQNKKVHFRMFGGGHDIQ